MSTTLPRPDPTPADRAGRPSLGRSIDRLLDRIGARSGAALVVDGLEALALRVAAARTATRQLDLQYYAWHADVTGLLLAREVLQAADRGVQVRLLLDDSGVLADDSAVSDLALMGAHPRIEVRLFNTHRWRGWGRFGFLLEFLLGGGNLNRRMHNKAWIADRRLAMVGGRNIGNEYFDAAGDFNFRDLDIAIAGQSAEQAQGVFERYWHHRLAMPATGCDGHHPDPAELDALRERLELNLARGEAQPYLRRLDASLEAGDILTGEGGLLPADHDLRVAADPPEKAAGEEEEADKLVHAVAGALDGAKREALLISPYFVPGEGGTEAIIRLVRQGVRVVVVTNSLAATDVVAVHGGYARYRRKLLKAGVEIHELKRSGEEDGGVLGSKGASLHTKAFAIDGRLIFVGSFNLDPRSANLNTEMGAFVRQSRLARRLREEQARLADPARSYRVLLKGGKMCWQDIGRTGKRRRQWGEPDASWRRRFLAQIVKWLPVESQL